MPIRRAPEDGGRPPLARGSACHRCFARKVRCSGQPEPSTGMHACAACLRTARFKGHELAHCRCAFGSEGLCSEEGGPNLLGEVYPNAGPGPRRKMTSRSSTSSSSRSLTSLASTSSSELSLASSSATSLDSPLLSPKTPISPTVAMSAMSYEGGAGASRGNSLLAVPPRSTPSLYQPPPASLAFELPPALPPYAPVPGLAPQYTPRVITQSAPVWPEQPSYPSQPYHQAEPSPPSAVETIRPFSPPLPLHSEPQPQPQLPAASRPPLLGADTCSKSLLARRAKAAPMSISLPPPIGSRISPVGSASNSRAGSPARSMALDSAPLDPPPNWASEAQSLPVPGNYGVEPDMVGRHHHAAYAGLPGVAPARDLGLENHVMAFGTSTPQQPLPPPPPPSDYGHLPLPAQMGAFPSYMSGAPSPGLLIPMGGFQTSLHLPLDPRQPVPAHFGTSFNQNAYAISQPTSMSQGVTAGSAPPTVSMGPAYAQVVADSPAHATPPGAAPPFDIADWTGSFHLYSPGLTFSSSTPHWFTQGAQTQYFQHRG
ncbi:hypothetical protein JCM10908_002292 [Rhodotorula pacifica]|uniref:uncharacterized protein n=1 Tax=Rhodotorula pacifica TaxID=1495444 RepID=UPI0031751487